MKVGKISMVTNPKAKAFKNVRRFVGKLKKIKEDRYLRKRFHLKKGEVITFRKDPNWCESEDSTYRNTTVAERVFYFPEDIKKMETMTAYEKMSHTIYLDRIGRYYHDDFFYLDTPELDKLMEEYGIDLNDFIVKEQKVEEKSKTTNPIVKVFKNIRRFLLGH